MGKKVGFFNLANLYNQAKNLVIEINHNGHKIEFDVNILISKRHKEEINPGIQFELLNSYLDYKGDEFKNKLFDVYKNTRSTLFDYVINPGGGSMYEQQEMIANRIIPPIYELMDINDVYNFLVNKYRLKTVKGLKDTFDETIIKDDRGSREQTYTNTDYLWLASLVVVLKTTLGPIGEYGYIENKNINSNIFHYIMFNFYRNSEIYKHPAFVKLVEQSKKIVDSVLSKTSSTKFIVADSMVPKDEIHILALSTAMFQKVIVSPIVDDTEIKNVITKLHNFIKNKVLKSGDKSGSYSDKKHLTGKDDESSESFAESYRISGDVTPGFQVEMNWNIDVVFNNPTEVCDEIDIDIVNEIYTLLSNNRHRNISTDQINIVSWILNTAIDPRVYIYVDLDSVHKALSVAYAYLYTMGFGYLALLIISSKIEDSDDVTVVNLTTNRTKISTDIKEDLDVIYPYNEVAATVKSSDKKEENVAVLAINKVANSIYKNRWVLLGPRRHIEEVELSGSININPDPNLKVMLAKMLVKHHSIRKNKTKG